MVTVSELFRTTRTTKHISLTKAADDLHIKQEQLEALEAGQFQKLPEPAYIRGFIKIYASYLKLDPNHSLALYRREYDETKYPKISHIPKKTGFNLTPNHIVNITFVTAVAAFVFYIAIQYSSILSAPKLEILQPQDDIRTQTAAIEVRGKTEKDATVSIDGDFVAIDQDGNFTSQIDLQEGVNVIEVVAAKRLSPKTKITRTIRLTR